MVLKGDDKPPPTRPRAGCEAERRRRAQAPRRAIRWPRRSARAETGSREPHPRVEHRVKHVRKQKADDVEERAQICHGADNREILALNRADQVVSEARDAEERFQNEIAQDEGWDRGDGRGHHGDHGVFQHVLKEHAIFRHALRSRRADVILARLVEEKRAVQPNVVAGPGDDLHHNRAPSHPAYISHPAVLFREIPWTPGPACGRRRSPA